MNPIKENAEEAQREHVSRYSKIGISAVVAAMRYHSEARNPEYAPVEPQERFLSTFLADAA
jgi:hypothetical protein